MARHLTSDEAREMVLKSWKNREKRSKSGPKFIPTHCPKCDVLCASRRQAISHCDGVTKETGEITK